VVNRLVHERHDAVRFQHGCANDPLALGGAPERLEVLRRGRGSVRLIRFVHLPCQRLDLTRALDDVRCDRLVERLGKGVLDSISSPSSVNVSGRARSAMTFWDFPVR
jgi:hypothetical protein